MTRPAILLFDVDGTLLSAGGAGRRALERAFAARCGTAEPLRGVRFNGMTDPGIVRAGLARLGRAAESDLVRAILEDYVALLPVELARGDGALVYPGVVPLLEALAADGGVAVGLGTGNVRAGAVLKLGRVGLDRHFAFGGFGCDHEERAELLRIGVRRGADHLGRPPAACRVVVVGDTPLDVAAARAIGAESLAVATGGCAVAELRAAGATWAFEDLTARGVRTALREGDAT